MIDPAKDAPWPERRFSQAIAEGDGISIIPIIRGDVAALALAALPIFFIVGNMGP